MSSLVSAFVPRFIAKRQASKRQQQQQQQQQQQRKIHTVHDTSPVTVESKQSALPANWHRGTFMQIFVRSYQDSKGTGVGDLRGVISRLDYLHELGVSGIWLMPVMECADRDHGYAVVNYRSVDPAYGSLADMDELIHEAHKRGIGIILDYVPNHSSVEHPAFLNARQGADAPHRDWYVWEDNMPSGWSIYDKNPWYNTPEGCYFAGFWEGMPDFNWRNPEVEAFHHNNLRFWLNRGIDGFRFDAVGNLVENGPDQWEAQPENFDVMDRMSAVVHEYDNRFVVCEIPRDPYSARSLEACKHTFAFGHQHNLLAAVRGDSTALRLVADRFETSNGTSSSSSSSKGELSRLATFLSNHDGFAGKRVSDQLNGDAVAMKLAASLYLLQPGVPFIYYGEEIGMGGGKDLPEDPSLRTPMSWGEHGKSGFTTHRKPYRTNSHNHHTHNVSAQHADPQSLLSHYRWLCSLRRDWRALREGTYEGVQAHNDTLVFRRNYTTSRGEREMVQVVVNVSDKERTVELGSLPRSSELAALCGRAEIGPLKADARGHARVSIAARSVVVWGRRFLSKVAIV